ncbi:ribonuclease P protein component [Patescibacteria group bacterium]|nr:ribonuclease P protein component [Patescibacteria group bacterium]
MLAKHNRITDQKDFIRVKDKGKVVQSTSFGLSYINRGDKNSSRFAFVVSGKVSKQAVIRNKVQRAMRESVRQSLSYIKPGYDIIFLAKEISARRYTSEMMHEVVKVLREEGIMK